MYIQAGSETSSTFLTWFIAYMINYPEFQERARTEVLNMVGRDTLPSLEDKGRLHYVSALQSEIFRHSSLTPFSCKLLVFFKYYHLIKS